MTNIKKILSKKVAKLVRNNGVIGVVVHIMMGVSEAKSCVIDEMARAIHIKPWT